jgi:hypothetical protein
MTEHTPLPWDFMPSEKWHDLNSGNAPSSVFHIGDYTVVTDDPSYEFHASDAEDAAYIVKACNAFPDLVKALEKIAAMDPWGVRADDLGRAARIARDAIADVKGPSHP